MRRFFSSAPLNTDAAVLLLRIFFGGYMILAHGYGKLMRWDELKADFAEPFGMPMVLAAGLTVFAEFFCALLVMLGAFTRAACIPLIIVMAVAALKIHAGEPWDERESSMIYMGAFTAILLLGAGKYSVDAVLYRKK